MSARSKLFAHEANAKPDMFFCLLKFNLKFLMTLWAVDRFIQILKIAKLGTRGEHMIRYGALARTNSRARRCSPLLLRSHPVLRSRLSPGSRLYFRHTSATRGGEYISIMSTPRRTADKIKRSSCVDSAPSSSPGGLSGPKLGNRFALIHAW